LDRKLTGDTVSPRTPACAAAPGRRDEAGVEPAINA
jgi:hypothetical protein